MAKKILGGFALIASVDESTDPTASSPAILLFYAVPNPVVVNRTFKFFWTTVSVESIRIVGPNGYDSGILSASAEGALDFLGGVGEDSTFVLAALDANGAPVMVNSLPVTSNLRVTVT